MISAPHLLTFGNSPINTVIGANVPARYNCNYDNSPTANGKYIHYAEGWSYAGDITRTHRTAASGDFFGCQWSVFELPGGVYRCVHTSRPLNVQTDRGDDTYVSLLAAYAMQQQWRLVHSFSTAGLKAQSGCSGIFVVTRVSYSVAPTPSVRTVRMELNSMGVTIRATRFTNDRAPEIL